MSLTHRYPVGEIKRNEENRTVSRIKKRFYDIHEGLVCSLDVCVCACVCMLCACVYACMSLLVHVGIMYDWIISIA